MQDVRTIDDEILDSEEFVSKVISLPLWDAKWNRSALLQKRTSIGEKRFNQQYRNLPSTGDENTFPNFDTCLISGKTESEYLHDRIEYYGGLDLATKKKPGSVIFTFGYDREKDLRIVWPGSVKVGKWRGPQLRDNLVVSYQQFHHKLINVETNALQESVYDFLKEECRVRLPIRSFRTQYHNKNDMTIGLSGLDVSFEQGKWVFIYGKKEHSPSCICKFCRLVSEFREHPNHPTQDIVMAGWLANRALTTSRGTPRQIRVF